MAEKRLFAVPTPRLAPQPFGTLTAPKSSRGYVALEKSGPPYGAIIVPSSDAYSSEGCRFINICHQAEYCMYSPEELRWNYISGMTLDIPKAIQKPVEQPVDPEHQRALQIANQMEMFERRLKIEFFTELEKAKRAAVPELAFVEQVATHHPEMTVGEMWKEIKKQRASNAG